MNDNVECTRCGYRWHAPEFAADDTLPDECTRCYRDTVQPIPPAPTAIDRAIDRITTTVYRIPERWHELEHRLILWKENHRTLLDMAAFVVAMLIIFALLYLFIFVWE